MLKFPYDGSTLFFLLGYPGISVASDLMTSDILMHRILSIRGHKVMLDSDLAGLYDVPTKRLNEQIKRNIERFPSDFMFQLTNSEYDLLRSHFATSRKRHGGRRYFPYAFTEHGAIMAATVLNSPKAVDMSIYVVRAFIRLREILSTNKELAEKLAALERRMSGHDHAIAELIHAIRQLTEPRANEKKRGIGFLADQ